MMCVCMYVVNQYLYLMLHVGREGGWGGREGGWGGREVEFSCQLV